ncbi:MAG: AAA family ATPase [Bryobacterales bacterium]|nr:AAA family ATPase [Bryobacterales bacterium]
MYIRKITIENIRGFQQLQFSLDRGTHHYAGWTVFTGGNGSGKSTLLKALAVALAGNDSARALQPSFNGWIREGENQGAIELEIVRVPDDDTITIAGRAPARNFPARIALHKAGRDTTLEPELPSGKPDSYATPQRSIWASDAKGWFSCGYGPFRRVLGASAEAARVMVAPNTERFVTMFREDASLAEVGQWLRDLNHKRLEGRQEETRQLDLLIEILRDEFMPNQITVDRVDSDGLWLRDRNGLALEWRAMSDGYRAALALLADILRHLIKAYGVDGLIERGEDGKIFVKRSGVVLIDEVDAHLHPEWQREIGFWLKKHFPDIQFLVTTHSPIICQAADENGLFVLPGPGSGEPARALSKEQYTKVIASRPDTILLTPAFGLKNTRSPLAVARRAEYSRLKAKVRAGASLSREEQERLDRDGVFAATSEEP